MEAVENLWTPQFSNDLTEVGLAEPMFSFQRKIFSFLLEVHTWQLPPLVGDAASLPGPSWPRETGYLPAGAIVAALGDPRSCTRSLAPLLHNAVIFALPRLFWFQKSCWKPEVCRVQCHLFLPVRTSALTSLSFSCPFCKLKIKNSPTPVNPCLVWIFYFCTHDQIIHYTILFITY